MAIKIFPTDEINGELIIPSSKSLMHRYIIASSLAKGKSILTNIDLNDDIKATIEAIKKLGINVYYKNNSLTIINNGIKYLDERKFDAHESGSTLRFLLPVFSYFTKKTIIQGSKKLISRPLDFYENNLKSDLIKNEDNIIVTKNLDLSEYNIDGNISSQFISALLFLSPILNHDTKIIINEPFESKSYALMTLNVLKEYSIKINYSNNIFTIKGNQEYKPINKRIESDYSSSAFFIALGLFNNLTIKSFNKDSWQGDKVIFDISKKMNGNITYKENNIIIKKSNLIGTTIDIQDCPDLAPILIILGLFSNGTTHLKNTKRLEYKESNRGLAMKEELNKLGISINLEKNDIYINQISKIKESNIMINPHHDHRIFMAFCILSLIAKIPLIIDDENCVNKSYRSFINDLKNLNIKVINI